MNSRVNLDLINHKLLRGPLKFRNVTVDETCAAVDGITPSLLVKPDEPADDSEAADALQANADIKLTKLAKVRSNEGGLEQSESISPIRTIQLVTSLLAHTTSLRNKQPSTHHFAPRLQILKKGGRKRRGNRGRANTDPNEQKDRVRANTDPNERSGYDNEATSLNQQEVEEDHSPSDSDSRALTPQTAHSALYETVVDKGFRPLVIDPLMGLGRKALDAVDLDWEDRQKR